MGRYEGVVVFVPLTAPQDLIRARVTLKKPRYWEAELVELLRPSPFRREAPCPVFARCGGCAWQHVSYEQQCVQKQQILAGSLRGLAKRGEFATLPFLAAREEFHYRNRIQVQSRGGKIGFFAKRSHDIVETDQCWISDPLIDAKMKTLKPSEAGRIELALSENGKVLTFAGERDPEAALFSQVNQAQNEVLIARVLDLARAEPKWVMDLYAGSGNLTFPLAAKFGNVEAVELSRASVERARAKSPPSVHWHAGDVAKVLAKMKVPVGEGLVVLDPPRGGCEAAVLHELERLAPRQIIYVSCNPSTFARDAERLGYRLESVQGLDMFPQTEHVELIASLVRCAAT